MSSFQPLRIIKGLTGSSLKRAGFRKALVVVQFSLAIGLIAGATGVYKQLNHLQTMDLGYNMENLVFFSSRGELLEQYETAKNEFLQIPGVIKVSASSAYPTGGRSNSSSWQWEGKDPELEPIITMMSVDSDFLETFEIPLIQGRFFRKENDHSGNPGEILINEKLAGIIGRENPINTRMSLSGRNYSVTGVIKDYIPNPSWRVDEPLILLQTPKEYRFIFLKIHPENIPNTLAQEYEPVFLRLLEQDERFIHPPSWIGDIVFNHTDNRVVLTAQGHLSPDRIRISDYLCQFFIDQYIPCVAGMIVFFAEKAALNQGNFKCLQKIGIDTHHCYDGFEFRVFSFPLPVCTVRPSASGISGCS
jgi:hypothetical protein